MQNCNTMVSNSFRYPPFFHLVVFTLEDVHHVKVTANNNLILETTVYKESRTITTYDTLKIQPGESIDYDAVFN